MKKFIIIFLFLIGTQIHAEKMQGGSYTLNGSMDVIINQGTGGTYALNPNGDGISSNSTGGPYVLYPTQYSNPAVAEVISAVVQSIRYGGGGSTYVPAATSTNPNPNPNNDNEPNEENNNNPQNPGNKPTVTGPDGSSGYYTDDGEFIPVNTDTDYGYENATDTVNFGRGTSTGTTTDTDESMSPLAKTFWWLLLIIIILIILRRLWNRVQGRV